MERERLLWFSSPVTWSWECRNSISRTGHILHISWQRDEKASTSSVVTASTLEDLLVFSPHHTATALATSARKQTPQHLERKRVALLKIAHWTNAASFVSFITEPPAMRSLFRVIREPPALPPSDRVRAQEVLVKQLRRRATHWGSDVRLDTGQLMRLDVWLRQPTDPSRWTWKFAPQL